MSSTITDTISNGEFSTSTTTLVEHPDNQPLLTIIPKLDQTTPDIEEGEITCQVVQESYPLSPQSSINILQARTGLESHTLRTIAISLTNTAIGRTFQHLKARDEIVQLCKKLTDFQAQMSHEPDAKCPDRFKENHSRLPNFTIPDTEGVMWQACYIKLGNSPVPFALGTLSQDGDPVFQYDLFATPSYICDTPTELLPMWLINAISRKSSSYHQAIELACSTDDWGLVAELACYHKSDTQVLNIMAEIHALDCELQVVKVASHQSRSCLEGARAQHHLWAL